MPPSTHFSRLLLAQLSFPQQSKRSGYHRDSYRGGLDKQTHAPYKGFKPSPIATSYSCARRFLVGFSSSEVFFFTASFQPGLSSGNLRAAWRQHSAKEAARRQRDEPKCRFTGLHFSLPIKCINGVKALGLAEYTILYRYSYNNITTAVATSRNSYF